MANTNPKKTKKRTSNKNCEQPAQQAQTQASEEDDCCQTNSQNRPNANHGGQPKFTNELFGHPREIPSKIREYFEKVPNSTPFENVNYTRVVRIDLCPRPCATPDPGFDITVQRVDIDFAVLKGIKDTNGNERFPDELIYELAYLFFMALKTKGVSLCKNFSAKKVLDGVFEQLLNPISEQNQKKIANAVLGKYTADDVIALLESNNIDPHRANLYASPIVLNDALLAEFNALNTKSTSKSADFVLEKFDNRYRPVPSSFDINFNGPTAVIFKSEVRHLRFMPEPFIYTNPRDRIYYRNEEIDNDFEWCAFVNAYDKGVVEDNLPSRTPCNQEHKIDLSMVLCVYVEEEEITGTECCEDKDCEVGVCKEIEKGGVNERVCVKPAHWRFTPIKIDPPHDNGGKG